MAQSSAQRIIRRSSTLRQINGIFLFRYNRDKSVTGAIGIFNNV